ncbi:MAG: hypothetical protein NUW06_08225 [Candidatus Acetothermia bacterium]|jgi:hypothetical protein|nr:hypothetical protein [Candidatus Acetothermia bacterium]MDH7506094.1 hypothetical protein [Candidatus Acetothermia bacterium]
MKRKLLLGVLSIALLSALVLALSERPAGQTSAGEIPLSAIEALKGELVQRGFVIAGKQFKSANVVFLCCNGFLESCYGNNAAAPYLTLTFDQGGIAVPEEIRLGPQDAIILVGRTPPPVSYFSYRSYLFSRYNPATGERDKLFISLGDTVNNETIQTGDGAGDEPFDRLVILVSTADRGTDQAVRAAAERAGFPEGIVNTDVIPASVTRLGLGEESDNLVFLHRLMLPQPGFEEDFRHYLSSPPYEAFIVRRASGSPGPDPFPMPSLTPRGTGRSELDLLPAMERLRLAILARYANMRATELTTSIWLTEGFDGLQRNVNLLGENRDTTYLASEVFQLADDPEEFLIVYGVNHDLLGKASYSNFTIYGDGLKIGIVGKNSVELYNSAADLLAGDPNADKFYAFKVARDCGGDPAEECLTIEPSISCPRLDLDGDLFVAFRAYLERATGVGPIWTELIYDRVIKFSPRE